MLLHENTVTGRLCLLFFSKDSIGLLEEMGTEGGATEKQTSTAAVNPATSSCRRKKSESATFIEDVKDHIDEFINASMDEHKTCFQKTISKVSYCYIFNFSRLFHSRRDLISLLILPHRCLECQK